MGPGVDGLQLITPLARDRLNLAKLVASSQLTAIGLAHSIGAGHLSV